MNDTIAGIIGTKRKDDGVIPKDATPIARTGIPKGSADAPTGSTAQPKASGSGQEQFIPTTVALVAPDCTPRAEAPLSPSQVPAPAAGTGNYFSSTAPGNVGAPTPAHPPISSSAPVALPAGIPDPGSFARMESQEGVAPVNIMEAAAAALVPGVAMPEHRTTNGAATYDAFRRLGGPKGGK